MSEAFVVDVSIYDWAQFELPINKYSEASFISALKALNALNVYIKQLSLPIYFLSPMCLKLFTEFQVYGQNHCFTFFSSKASQ